MLFCLQLISYQVAPLPPPYPLPTRGEHVFVATLRKAPPLLAPRSRLCPPSLSPIALATGEAKGDGGGVGGGDGVGLAWSDRLKMNDLFSGAPIWQIKLNFSLCVFNYKIH